MQQLKHRESRRPCSGN